MKKKKSWKHQAAVGATCAAVGAGILVNSAFDSPAELMNDANSITMTAQAGQDYSAGSGYDDEDRQTGRFSLRRWFLRLPIGVRVWVCLPLWCIGWVVLGLAGLLYHSALTPAGGILLSWILAAAMVLGVFCLTAKAMFPQIPLKKLLRPRHFLLLLGGMFILGIADYVLPYFWEDYPALSRLLRMLGSALLVGIGALGLYRLRRRVEKKDVSPHTEVEQAAMSLADSVCPQPVYRAE